MSEFIGRKAKPRRQSHGSAWHWIQTDCWCYTMPGTKKRVALFNEQGERIRGLDNKMAAEVALARERLSWVSEAGGSTGGEWIVARVCLEYLQHCEHGFTKGTISRGHRDNSSNWLAVAKLTRRLLKACALDGVTPVFRNPHGRPWKKVTGVHCFLAIKRDSGWDQDPVRRGYSCYTCRHSFAHRMCRDSMGNNSLYL